MALFAHGSLDNGCWKNKDNNKPHKYRAEKMMQLIARTPKSMREDRDCQ